MTWLTIAARSGKQRETPSSARVVLIVDQFELTWTECQQEIKRQAFITTLCTVSDVFSADDRVAGRCYAGH